MTVRNIGEDLKAFIQDGTGRPVGLNEVPEGVNMPFYNIRPITGPEMDGSVGEPNSMEDQVFNIDTVGSTTTQVEEAQHRMLSSLNWIRGNISGVMGPPTIRRNGTNREDDRTYRAMVIITIAVDET